MKRLLFFLLCTTAVLCLLAAPALALTWYYAPPPPGTAYVYAIGDSENNNATVWYDLENGQVVLHDEGTSIPSGDTVWLYVIWYNPVRGEVQSLQSALSLSATLSNCPAPSLASWSPVYESFVGPDWNKANVKNWAREWTACVGRLQDGTYDGVSTMTITHPLIDFSVYGFPGQHAPVHDAPGTSLSPFTFTVGPPSP
jgi:hypothetical protein